MSKFTDKRVGQPVWWPFTSSENLVSIDFVLIRQPVLCAETQIK